MPVSSTWLEPSRDATFNRLSVSLPAQPDYFLLQRLSLGLLYGASESNTSTFLSFGFNNILDFLSPMGISFWKSAPMHEWEIVAADGEELPLPPSFDSWSELNKTAILRTGSLSIYAISEHSKHPDCVHWVSTVLLPGSSCYVLHLLAPKIQVKKEIMETFLSAFSYMMVRCDGENAISNGNDSRYLEQHALERISTRQLEILRLAGQDLTYAQIAHRLGFSESTIKQESMKIFRALGVNTKTEALEIFNR